MAKGNKKLEIDFLYLDLSSCDRCRATDKVLDDALEELREEIRGVKKLIVNKIKIESDDEAKKYDFVRSPTIRINDIDIEKILTGKLEIKDSYCESCASGCGESCSEATGGGTQCRVVDYKGKTYETVPKEMIKDAIRKVLGIETREEVKGEK
jgi:thiol-disulfide isomerase/thioredoxin